MNVFSNLMFRSSLLLSALLSISTAYAGVVLNSTRVIFNDGQNEKTIQLQNKDVYPNLVQLWIDEGDENSSIENTKAPFMISPQVFRLNANTSQVVRLVFTGQQQVPNDRESLYYMNFSEFPAAKKQDSDENRLMVVFKNRVKVFYRPKNIVGDSTEVQKKLRVKLLTQGPTQQLQIENPTAYYANIQQLSIINASQQKNLKNNEMIAPKTSVNWSIPTDYKVSQTSTIKLTLINDYGTLVSNEIPLN
ncbi:fimbrial chaperone protein [Acinetobacter calcoaceticus]|uniref:Fimbrial chaperone protein n=1 Tax=Acinetobacter calcoaceticus TaxID=471 RepID=A0A4R1XZ96_ACICA|nr:fimbrial chaperone protein [Acinetobacter calcoaceticus]